LIDGFGQSFPKRLRLIKAAEFKKVFADPIKSSDRYFTILIIRNEQGYPRLGLAIAKKTVKKAVRRNALKRMIRESFRLHQHDLACFDIVVLARIEALDARSNILRSSLEKHWQKAVKKCARH
jgi:ribonuclease P protein component